MTKLIREARLFLAQGALSIALRLAGRHWPPETLQRFLALVASLPR